eukprot:Tamp_40894.p2 GENE.Tamp_40894~~Tamp_40894.p2  ORF type:complete len:125 (+),score=25.90 Tamp_40894:61-435(+)
MRCSHECMRARLTTQVQYVSMCARARACAGCAEKLAAKNDWGMLYDLQQLRANKVPTAAAVYFDDIYVERALSEQTAALVGSEGGTRMKLWVTNEYQHSGIRDDGYRILDRLLGMLDGSVNLPS